jgi:Zn-dependent membrane protease YugP
VQDLSLSGYILVMVVGIIILGIAAFWVRSTYSKYSKRLSASGLPGARVARAILDRNNLSNVRVEPVAGTLTNHFDPRRKALRLSESNFRGNSIAAVSVAAHECGHAIQDATGYVPMKLRSGLFPLVAFSSQIWVPLFFIGVFVGAPLFIQLAAILFGAVLAFHLVTLPVEINASTRAYDLLTRYGLLSREEAEGTRRVLYAAAFTYIAAALTAFLTLLYLLFLSQSNE